MKVHFRRSFLSAFLIVVLCFLSEFSFAQIGDDNFDPDTPIDGGLSILIAAGVGYGIKKVRDERKKRTNNL